MALPTREGYLFKYRNKLAGWDNRYFKLDRSYFHYYETKDAPTSRKTVLRTDIVSVNECSSFPDRKNCLEVVIKGNDKWYIQCGSEFDLKEWAKALLSHVADGDRRKEWLESKIASAPEISLPVPQMPQYMMIDSHEEPPSYRTATNVTHYQQGHQHVQLQFPTSNYPSGTGIVPSAPYRP